MPHACRLLPRRGDCDDENADVHPGGTEVCDAEATDEDCDGDADDEDGESAEGTLLWFIDYDGDGWGFDACTLV